MQAFDPNSDTAKFVVIGTSLKSAAFYPTEQGIFLEGGYRRLRNGLLCLQGPLGNIDGILLSGKSCMLAGKKIAVVMPAYNAELTLGKTVAEIPRDIVDDRILTDDGSSIEQQNSLAHSGFTLTHDKNCGYGANQKTCYASALARGADIVVMLHPDYQYSPKLVTAMASMVCSEHYDVVLGSRIIGNDAIKGGMPTYKYIANRLLTLWQNLLLGQKLSEYHTGFRAWS